MRGPFLYVSVRGPDRVCVCVCVCVRVRVRVRACVRACADLSSLMGTCKHQRSFTESNLRGADCRALVCAHAGSPISFSFLAFSFPKDMKTHLDHKDGGNLPVELIDHLLRLLSRIFLILPSALCMISDVPRRCSPCHGRMCIELHRAQSVHARGNAGNSRQQYYRAQAMCERGGVPQRAPHTPSSDLLPHLG